MGHLRIGGKLTGICNQSAGACITKPRGAFDEVLSLTLPEIASETAVIPLSVDVPMRRVPWANWVLIAITVVISLAVPARREVVGFHDFGPKGAAEFRLPLVEYEYSPLVLQPHHFKPYQLVTSLFQHAGPLHLFGN